ncbi:MAG: ribosome small subunit-dependent GTPase A [Aristaeellaceae bacterium]
MTYTGIVLTQSHNLYTVCLAEDHTRLLTARVSGKMMHAASSPTDYPTVGDRVHLAWDGQSDNAVIQGMEERRSTLCRVGNPMTGESQLIAANLDVLLMCMSLNQNFSLGRAERYIAAALAGGVTPIIVLTKADLTPEADARLRETECAFPYIRVLLNSQPEMPAVQFIRELLAQGKTIAFAGSSGVGKSTLVNAVLGSEAMATSAIREADGRGRHTTTHRELLFPDCGGAIIDTPGMRAFALDDAAVDNTFLDISDFAGQCRFSDCTHMHEPGCAVRRAVADGLLDPAQLDRYVRLKKEEQRRQNWLKFQHRTR